jgi:hypothetical protein
MPAPKFIDIDGQRFLWRELVRRRREQLAAVNFEQPVLFEMKEDARPASERTAAGHYSEPTLFAFHGEEGIGSGVTNLRSPAKKSRAGQFTRRNTARVRPPACAAALKG